QGQLISQVGTQAFMVGMLYWTMEATGSASLMGTLLMLSILPGVILGPFGGTLADRYSRWWIIVLCDLVAGLAVLLVCLPFFFRWGETKVLIALLLAVSGTLGVILAFFRPAVMAAIPDLVPPERVPAANSLNQFSLQSSVILGQGLGGIAYSLVGAPILFLIDGLSYLFAAGSETFIEIPQRLRPKTSGWKDSFRAFWHDTKDGLHYVWNQAGMRNFLILVGLVHLFVMPLVVMLPFFVEINLRRGSEWYGFLMAGFSSGSVLGYVIAGFKPFSPHRRGVALILLLLSGGLLFSFLGFVHRPLLALVLEVIMGVALGIFNINAITLFQTSTSTELRGRVMGLVMTIAMSASPLGMFLGGVAGDLTGKNLPLIYGSCGAGILASILLLGMRPSVLQFLRGKAATERC
ncbi:MAG: MFS transporter, partial [Acidobacteria bacterium]